MTTLMTGFKRRRLLAVAILLGLLSVFPPLSADFESASEAYRSQNYAVAFELFSALAEAGDARSQTVLGIMYKYGESVPIDLEQSFAWYSRAAEQGYPPAQYNAGVMLVDGIGAEQDTEQAIIWLEQAAAANFDRAINKLAEIRGEVALRPLGTEPIAWSKQWNLRLPNHIRFADETVSEDSLKVFRVQLGAMSSPGAARLLWLEARAGNEHLLDVYQPIFRQGTYRNSPVWRVQFGQFRSRPQAEAICRDYLDQPDSRTGCLVVLTD